MEHDSAVPQAMPLSPELSELIEEAMSATAHPQPEQALSRRSARLSQTHLAWTVVWGLLMGYRSQLDLWRLIGLGFRRFAPLRLTNQALYKRLSQSSLEARHGLLLSVSRCLASVPEERLAPFASDVPMLDESKLDQVGRWLSGLREQVYE